MNLNLYMKTDRFNFNKGMAEYFQNKLSKKGLKIGTPTDEDYMYSLEAAIDGEVVIFYMGKNDEASSPLLWQIWPQQKIPLLKKLFGKPNREPEEKAKRILEEIANEIEGAQGVAWAI